MWSESKDAPSGLDDLVNYATVDCPSTLLLKDGGLLTAWHFAGPDLALAAPEELERLAAQANDGAGAMWQRVDAARRW